MDRLISEKQVLDAVDKTCCGSIEFRAIYERCEELIKAIPSADSKTGHWIDTGSGQMCSRCGEIQYGYDSFRRFCASCGIRMVEPQAENKCNPNDCPHPYGTYETCIKCKEDCGARMFEPQEREEGEEE